MKHLKIIVLLLLALLIIGCLQPITKEYSFHLKPDGSGNGKIRFVDICSVDAEGEEGVVEDFDLLINDYVQGNYFEEENAQLNVTDKKLFEENGILVGEITFEFASLTDAGLFRYDECDCCPIMLIELTLGETIGQSNGKLADGVDGIYLWDKDESDISFSTVFEATDSGKVSLLPMYNEWLKQ